jgi:hypothetical protein
MSLSLMAWKPANGRAVEAQPSRTMSSSSVPPESRSAARSRQVAELHVHDLMFRCRIRSRRCWTSLAWVIRPGALGRAVVAMGGLALSGSGSGMPLGSGIERRGIR